MEKNRNGKREIEPGDWTTKKKETEIGVCETEKNRDRNNRKTQKRLSNGKQNKK